MPDANVDLGNLTNSNISASAAIAFSKLASLTSAHILIGSAGGVVTDTAVTGDISISNTGVTAYAGTVPVNKGGTGVTTSTGTGSVVLSNSPTLVTPTIGVATATSISASTTTTSTGLQKTGQFVMTDNATTADAGYAVHATSNGTGASMTNIAGYFTAANAGTSNVGIQIDAITTGTNNYAIYSTSAAKSYFQGIVGIGGTPNAGYSSDYLEQIGTEAVTGTNYGLIIRSGATAIGKLSFSRGANTDGEGRIWYDQTNNRMDFYTNTGKQLSISSTGVINSVNLAGTGTRIVNVFPSGDLSTAATTGSGSVVLATSPTLTTPVISSIVNTGTLTLPTSTDTLVGRATTDTLTNKTYSYASTTKTAAYTATTTDYLIVADATTAGFTVTLPSASSVTGQQFIVKKKDSTTNVVTIATAAGSIDNAVSPTITTQNTSVTLQSDGTQYWRI
jgi:hypothetical protein